MNYKITFTSSARRTFARLPEAVAAAVIELLRGPLTENPHRVGKQLMPPLEGFWSARRGEWRILYEIDDSACEVSVHRIEHRRDVYRPH